MSSLGLSSYAEENTGKEKRGTSVNYKTQMRGKFIRLSWKEMFSVETENVGFLLEFA